MPAKPATNVLLHAAKGVLATIARTHWFKVGQTVNLIASISRTAAQGHFEIVACDRSKAKLHSKNRS
jgi:hypothetical protein